MRGFTIRNDMVQRVTTVTLCCIIAATLFSSPTLAEDAKNKDGTTSTTEAPKNEMSRRMGMGHGEILDRDSTRRHPQQQFRRQFRQQQIQPQQQQETHTVYIAMENGSPENQIPRRKGPRNGRRRRVRGRKLHRSPAATHYYTPAVVQSMPLSSHTLTHTVRPSRYQQSTSPTLIPVHVMQDINSASATATNDPKNYAFAYAVRDTDAYTGDDFSHKEARDGKLTMGEYKVVLPDGRTQVVRYTAGSKHGYKADVTYEDEEEAKKGRRGKPKYHPSPTSSVHKHYASPPSPSHAAQHPYKNPIYFSKPVKAPQVVFRSHDTEYKHPYQLDNQISVSATPSPNIVFKAGPRRRPRLPPPSQATFINGLVPSTRPFHGPKSIYDKMHHTPSQSQALKFGRPLGHLEHDKSPRAGPIRSGYNDEPSPRPTQHSYTGRPSSVAPTQYDTHSAYSHPGNDFSINNHQHQPFKFKISSQTPTAAYNEIDSPDISPSPSPTPFTHHYSRGPSGKSKLVPIEYFKAGPATESSPLQLQHHGKVRKSHRRLRPKPHHHQNVHQEQYHTAFESKPSPSPTPQYHISSTPAYHNHISSTSPSYEREREREHDHDHHHSEEEHHRQRPTYHREQDDEHDSIHQQYHYQKPYLPVSTFASPTVSSFTSPTPSHRPSHQQHQPSQQQPTQQSYFYNSLHGPDSHEIHHSSQGTLPKVKSSLATYTSSYPGVKSPLYYKTPSQLAVGRPVRPSTGGLVYLETPGRGPRPTVVGVKQSLDKIPFPQTTTHPYEVGSADYGKSVGYSTIDSESRDPNSRKPFTPSEEIPPQYVPHLNSQYDNHHHHPSHNYEDSHDDHDLQHHPNDDIHSFMREYLMDTTKDSIVPERQQQQLDTRLGSLDRDAEYAFQFNL